MSFKPHIITHNSFRSFIVECLKYDIQPIIHCRDGAGYLYYIDEVVSKHDRIVSPSAEKSVLDKVWNEIGILRFRLRECFHLINLENPTIKEVD